VLKPTLDVIIRNTTEWMISIRESIKEGGAWSYVIIAINSALKAMVTTIVILGDSFSRFIANVKAGITFFKEGSAAAAKQWEADVTRIQAATQAKMKEIWGPPEEAVSSFRDRWDAMGRIQAGALDEMGRKRLEMAMKQIDSEIKIVELGFERQRLIYEGDVGALGITESQKIRLVSAASQERYAAEIELLQRKLQLGGLDVAQRAEIEAKITEMVLTAKNDRLKLENDYVEGGPVRSGRSSPIRSRARGAANCAGCCRGRRRGRTR